ncbi:MAG: hypothetical protein KME64_12145 [Scytonematopsis contorta HA4267-MV1]|jgi:hypothetical protein|nr:hypothetical protein [Scytonematopsis contorta HA4267-MV1]
MTANNIRQNTILIDVQGRQPNAEPGSIYERVITVQNRDSKQVDLFLWLSTSKGKDQEVLRWYNLEAVDADFSNKNEISLKLKSGESKRVYLNFKIPLTAEPGIYNYEVCVRSSISSEPVCRHQQLNIPYSKYYWEYVTEPEFSITPASSSENPQVINPGESSTFDIKVKNRSNSVDNFTVVLPELSEDFNCYLDYPDSNPVDGLRLNPGDEGVIKLLLQPKPKKKLPPGQYFSTLRLKSRKSKNTVLGAIYLNIPVDGSLTIDFSPPSHKIPSPTETFELKIHNSGNIQRRIKFSAKDDENLFKYKFEPANLLLEANEEKVVILIPQANYTSFTKRSWKGEEIQVPFQVDIANITDNTTELDTNLYLPENPSGLIVWKPHPSWYNWFLNRLNTILFLLAFLALGLTLGYFSVILVHNLIWKYVVKPSLQPKVTELVATEKSYQAGQGDGIRLNWEIKDFGELGKVEVYRSRNEITVLTHRQLFATKYDKGGIKISEELQKYNSSINNIEDNYFVRQSKLVEKNNSNKLPPFTKLPTPQDECSKTNIIDVSKFFDCNLVKPLQKNLQPVLKELQRNVLSPVSNMTAEESHKKQKYIDIVSIPPQFEQKVLGNTEVLEEGKEIGFCKLKTVPLDKSPLHYFWKVIYDYKQEMKVYKKYEGQVLRCSNMLAARFQPTNSPSVPSLANLPTTVLLQPQIQQTLRKNRFKDEGNYEFEIKLSTEQNTDIVSASKTIKDIKVTPAPPPPPPPPEPPLPQPEIQVFAPLLPIYRQLDIANISNKANKVQDNSSPQLPKPPVKVNWVITNPKNISRLEVTVVFFGLDGKTQKIEIKPYSFLSPNKPTTSTNKISDLFVWQVPSNLPCRLLDNQRLLTCDNIPINANAPGQYKLTLTAFPIIGKRAKELKSVSKTIEAVNIKPSLPQIQNFKVNGLDVLKNPNQILTVEPGKNPSDVDISWQVKNPEQMTVELLPAPGVLPASMNKMQYKLSPNPGSTPITLKVTNQAGESVTQTVMLQTAVNVPPQIKPGTVPLLPPPPPPVDGAKPSSNVPLNPEDLPPFELPPKSN